MHQRLAVVTILTLVFGACEQAMAPQELLPGPRFSTTGGGYTAIDLGHLGGDAYITRSLGLAINDNGQVVGWSRTPSGAVHAFFWDGTMHDLGTLGGAASQAVAVNTAGRAVGWSTISGAGSSPPYRAFLWDGTMHNLGTLGGTSSYAVAINDAGQVVGGSQTASGQWHAFIWDGAMHDLGTLGGSDSYALAVNRAGLVVGRSRTVSGAYHPFLWDGTMHNLGSLGGNDSYAYDINDAGVVVGFGRTASNNWHAFVWDGTVRDLGTLGGGYSFAWAINDAGQIAGSALTASSGERAFLWDGTMHNLGTLGGAYSSPGGGSLWDLRMPGTKSINNAGQVVGRSRTASGGYHPFLWDGTMHDLGTLGGDDSRAMAINDAGQAVGSSMLASGESHATLWRILTPVEQVQAIIDLIESMNVDVSTSLIAKLNVVTAMLNDGRTGSAVRLLDAFISHVEGLRGNKLTSGQADQLQALAQAALDQLSA